MPGSQTNLTFVVNDEISIFGTEQKTIQHRIQHGPRVCQEPKSNPTGLSDGEVFIFWC